MKEKLILPCVRGSIGDWVYYSSAMNAVQIKNWVMPAKSIKVSKRLDDYLQRDLKNREAEISKYLLKHSHRFFNSLLIGVYGGIPDWVEFDITSKIKSLNGDPNDFKELVGLLLFDQSTKMFAIDGQHRVQGIIKSLRDKKNNTTDFPIEEDLFSVIFLAHYDDTEGKKRTRRLFSDINKKAIAIPTKDKIIIDEEDLCAIVTRRVYSKNKYLKKGKLIEIESSSLSLDSKDVKHFTNLSNLYTVVKKLKPCYRKVPKSNDYDNENVESLESIVEDFFNFIINNCKELNSFFNDKKLSLVDARKNNNYILFRPIGLTLLSKLYTYFRKKKELEILEASLNQISFVMPNSPLKNILWREGRMLAGSENQKLAFNLLLYLLNQKIPRKTEEGLLKDFRGFFKDDMLELPERIILN